MSSHQHTAFLCGHFSTSATISGKELESMGWKKIQMSDEMRKTEKRYFYPEFVDFCYSKDTENDCARYTKSINETQTINIGDTTISFRIKELTLYIMPFNMALFSVHIEQDTDNLNNCTKLLFSLRSVDFYGECHKAFTDKAIAPVIKIYEILTGRTSASCSDLIENGNKLKIFQIINTFDEKIATLPEEDKDKLLYELATTSKVTKPGEVDEYSTAISYLNKTLETGKISVFRNWSGLALMDTFTIHAFRASDRLVNNWTDTYFQMIYIHSLFLKSYLFNLNIRFRVSLRYSKQSWKSKLQRNGVHTPDIRQLVEEYEDFEQQCCFHKISYNFLPLEIVKAIDNGLNIEEERSQLYTVMEKEKNRRDEANDKFVNSLLFCLSILTLGSAVWDTSCLLDQVFPFVDYMGGQVPGYRSVTLFLFLSICFLFIIMYRHKKTKS